MANRRQEQTNDDEWACALGCKQTIKVGEPFTLLLVRAAPPEVSRNLPAHLSCNINLFAGEVADAVVDALAGDDDDDNDTPARGRAADPRTQLRRSLERAVGGMFNDLFRGG